MGKETSEFFERLESLRLAVRRTVRARREGDRATSRRGGAADFVAHRPYVPGDDLRAVDWHVYARLGQFFVRERSREEQLMLHLVFDVSRSMEVGQPSKLRLAREVAAGLSAAALAESGRVAVWGSNGSRECGSLSELLRHLESLELSGADPRSQLEIVHRSARTRGLVAFFSDLWDERLREPLLSCTSAGDLVVLHVLSPSERVPEAWGRVRIADAESGEELERFVGPEEVRKYQELLHEQCEAWRGWCLEHGISYVRFGSETPWIDVVTVTLREAGVVEGWD